MASQGLAYPLAEASTEVGSRAKLPQVPFSLDQTSWINSNRQTSRNTIQQHTSQCNKPAFNRPHTINIATIDDDTAKNTMLLHRFFVPADSNPEQQTATTNRIEVTAETTHREEHTDGGSQLALDRKAGESVVFTENVSGIQFIGNWRAASTTWALSWAMGA
ncbi:hypothetical protein MMC21_006560 [Puttea exsequens]|nr:hypothetical protein [Puttea exsequens]